MRHQISPHVAIDRNGLRIESEHLGRRRQFLGLHDRVVGNRQRTKPLIYQHLDLGVHTRLQQAGPVVEEHDHREHGDVLLHYGLGLDLLDRALEGPVGEGLHAHRSRHPGHQLTHIRLVDQRADAHVVQIGHGEQRVATGHVLRRRLDDLPVFDQLLQNDAGHRRPNGDVVQPQRGKFQVRLGAYERRLRVRVFELGLFELLRGDHLGLEQFLRAIQLGPRDADPRLRHVQIGDRLIVRVLDIPGIHPGQNRARFDLVPRVDQQVQNLAGGLGFDLYPEHRLQFTRGLGGHPQIADLGRRDLNADLRRFFLLGRARCQHQGRSEGDAHRRGLRIVKT